MQTWTALGIEPAKLADSAKHARRQGEALAGSASSAYFDKLVKNEVQFVDVAYPVSRALQKKYEFAVNDAGLERVVERPRHGARVGRFGRRSGASRCPLPAAGFGRA